MLAMVKNAAVNTGLQMYLQNSVFIFFREISRSGTDGSQGGSQPGARKAGSGVPNEVDTPFTGLPRGGCLSPPGLLGLGGGVMGVWCEWTLPFQGVLSHFCDSPGCYNSSPAMVVCAKTFS